MKHAKSEIVIAFTHWGPNGAGKEGDGQGMVSLLKKT